MKVLAIETATEACSAAYADDDQIIERFQIDPKGHSERILPMVESVLSEAGVVRAELEAIVFDSGPGSFTGIRIGAGVAQGIALGLDLPLVAVSSLMGLAQGVSRVVDGCTAVLPAIDARMGQVYWACLVRDPQETTGWRWQQVPQVTEPEAVDDPGIDGIGVGSGWDRYAEILCRNGRTIWHQDRYPSARDLIEVAQRLLCAGSA
ncbi:MAG TPA: tRNA (adenosine(37)-N6)-threonylcarbamoyltransferase complex dimerization subunit type 1 TsaB, partial [Gammaproteobacteria bacterium]|nr:tRNA (adenosine(37)-N6)-threonylcarbamoyltransferase complex dimerization subunit type 1 TsaB [Gammaproteobacteria bacterium]